jgi:hypothetical protein
MRNKKKVQPDEVNTGSQVHIIPCMDIPGTCDSTPGLDRAQDNADPKQRVSVKSLGRQQGSNEPCSDNKSSYPDSVQCVSTDVPCTPLKPRRQISNKGIRANYKINFFTMLKKMLSYQLQVGCERMTIWIGRLFDIKFN